MSLTLGTGKRIVHMAIKKQQGSGNGVREFIFVWANIDQNGCFCINNEQAVACRIEVQVATVVLMLCSSI